MRLQKATNNWSCLLDSFAMALDVPVENLIEYFGHDGTDICSTDKRFRRGFHIQECIEYCLVNGFSCTEIQLAFASVPFVGSNDLYTPYETAYYLERFDKWLANTSQGVLTGLIQHPGIADHVGHAVAWDGSSIYDSRGYIYPFKSAMNYSYHPQTLWIINKLR
jgi:hypothetical protein